METFLWGFVKSFPTPTWSPKLRPEQSDGIAPLTYCSDMQIPSLPLKTESTSTFKANFGFIVHVARWSAAAQHSWLARAPADAVPGSSRPLRPSVLGTAAGDDHDWGMQPQTLLDAHGQEGQQGKGIPKETI